MSSEHLLSCSLMIITAPTIKAMNQAMPEMIPIKERTEEHVLLSSCGFLINLEMVVAFAKNMIKLMMRKAIVQLLNEENFSISTTEFDSEVPDAEEFAFSGIISQTLEKSIMRPTEKARATGIDIKRVRKVGVRNSIPSVTYSLETIWNSGCASTFGAFSPPMWSSCGESGLGTSASSCSSSDGCCG